MGGRNGDDKHEVGVHNKTSRKVRKEMLRESKDAHDYNSNRTTNTENTENKSPIYFHFWFFLEEEKETKSLSIE